MFDISVFIDEVVVKKGEDFVNSGDKHLYIAMFYIFESKETRDAVYEALKESSINFVDPKRHLEKFDVEEAQENMKRVGVSEYIIVDGAEAEEKVDMEKVERSIVTAMKFKSLAHKRVFMNLFRLAKKYGVLQ